MIDRSNDVHAGNMLIKYLSRLPEQIGMPLDHSVNATSRSEAKWYGVILASYYYAGE